MGGHSHRAYIYILKDSVLLFIVFFINCCRTCYNRNSRVAAASHVGPEESVKAFRATWVDI